MQIQATGENLTSKAGLVVAGKFLEQNNFYSEIKTSVPVPEQKMQCISLMI